MVRLLCSAAVNNHKFDSFVKEIIIITYTDHILTFNFFRLPPKEEDAASVRTLFGGGGLANTEDAQVSTFQTQSSPGSRIYKNIFFLLVEETTAR